MSECKVIAIVNQKGGVGKTTVQQGQIIALVGSTGYSTGPHTNFAVIENGIRVNAMVFFTWAE